MQKKIFVPQQLPVHAENHIFAYDYTESLDKCMTSVKKGLWLSDNRVISLDNRQSKRISFIQAYDLGNGNIIAGQYKIIECKDYFDCAQNVLYAAFTCANSMNASCALLYLYKFDMNEPDIYSAFHNPCVNICNILQPRILCGEGVNYHIDFNDCNGLRLNWQNAVSASTAECKEYSYDLHADTFAVSTLINRPACITQMAASAPAHIHYECSEYEDLWVVAIEPYHYNPGAKYPAITICLGGPYTEIPNFEEGHSIYDIFSKAGFWVIVPLRRGVRGVSSRWEHLIDGDYGNKDIEDIIVGTNYILSQYPDIDAARVALYGGSYGGYSAMMIAGKYNENNIYKAIIAHCGIYDLERYPYECSGNADDIMRSYADTNDTTAYKKAIHHRSPHNYVEQWQNPILVIHTTDDNTVWFGQSVRAYNEAFELNKSVHLLLSTGSHTLLVDNMVDIVNIMLKFIREHLSII